MDQHTPLSPLLFTDGVFAHSRYATFCELHPELQLSEDEFFKVYEKELWRNAWAYAQAQRTPEPFDSPPKLELDAGHQKLSDELERAIQEGGRWCFHVDCGTGKTHGAALSCFDLWQHAFWTSFEAHAPRIAFVVANNQLAHELEHKLRELAPLHLTSHAAEALEVELVQAPKRTADNCQKFDVISAAHRVHHKSAAYLCKQCPHREGCGFLHDTKRPRGKITILTHELAFSYLQSREMDLVIIDEGIAEAMYPSLSLSLEQLAALKATHGFSIADHAWSQLTDLLSQKQGFSSPDLAHAMPPGSLLYHDDAYVHGLIEQTAHASTPEQLALLAQAPSLDALHALERCAQQGWKGAFIEQGKLCLPIERPLDLSKVRTVLYLDATTSPLHAHAVLGKDHTRVRIPIALPDHVQIHHIDWSWSKNLVRFGKVRYGVNQRRMDALVSRYDSPLTAWIVHKDHRQCDTIARSLQQAEHQDRVLHYGTARGSNRFEHMDTVVVTARHLPFTVIGARAELLVRLTGASLEQAYEEARLVLEEGEMVQAAHRIRPTRSTSPMTIVIVDERGVDELEPTHFESIDVLVMDELGQARGAQCMDALLLRHVEHATCLIPAFLSRYDTHNEVIAKNSYTNTSLCSSHLSTQLNQHRKKFFNHVNTAWQSNWQNYARYAGLEATMVRTSQGGAPLAVLHQKYREPSREELDEYMSLLGLYWYEWQGELRELHTARSKVYQALSMTLNKKDATFKGLAKVARVNEKTMRQWCRQSGFTKEALIDLWELLDEERRARQEEAQAVCVMHPMHEKDVLPRDTIEKKGKKTSGRAPPG